MTNEMISVTTPTKLTDHFSSQRTYVEFILRKKGKLHGWIRIEHGFEEISRNFIEGTGMFQACGRAFAKI